MEVIISSTFRDRVSKIGLDNIVKLHVEYVQRETSGPDGGFECVQVHFRVRGRGGRREWKERGRCMPNGKNILV